MPPLAQSASEYGRSFYSSELFNNSYRTTTNAEQPPGIKWSSHRFSSGIHASAANERFIKQRAENVDRRPFAGAPYNPTNTFVTTGRIDSQPPPTISDLSTYPVEHVVEELTVQPPQRAAQTISLASYLASR